MTRDGRRKKKEGHTEQDDRLMSLMLVHKAGTRSLPVQQLIRKIPVASLILSSHHHNVKSERTPEAITCTFFMSPSLQVHVGENGYYFM